MISVGQMISPSHKFISSLSSSDKETLLTTRRPPPLGSSSESIGNCRIADDEGMGIIFDEPDDELLEEIMFIVV